MRREPDRSKRRHRYVVPALENFSACAAGTRTPDDLAPPRVGRGILKHSEAACKRRILLAAEKTDIGAKICNRRATDEVVVKFERRHLFAAQFVEFERTEASVGIALGNENLYAFHE